MARPSLIASALPVYLFSFLAGTSSWLWPRLTLPTPTVSAIPSAAARHVRAHFPCSARMDRVLQVGDWRGFTILGVTACRGGGGRRTDREPGRSPFPRRAVRAVSGEGAALRSRP